MHLCVVGCSTLHGQYEVSGRSSKNSDLSVEQFSVWVKHYYAKDEAKVGERRFALSGASSVCDLRRSPWEGETSLTNFGLVFVWYSTSFFLFWTTFMPSAFSLSAPILLTSSILSSILLKLKVKAQSYL